MTQMLLIDKPKPQTTCPPTPPARQLPTRPRGLGAFIVLHAVVIFLAAISLTPFAWLICATFKSNADFFKYPFLPWDNLRNLTLDNYRWLFTRWPFATWILNSLFVACAHTCLVVTLSSLGGFALAKYRFAGKKFLMFIMLCTMLLPSQVLLSGNYLFMYKIGWLDRYAAILVPAAVSVFGMLLFTQAMRAVPDELLQAGRVDGCSEFRLWWEVALPIVRPMTGAYTLLSFMGAWNSFLWPQIVLQTQAKYTLPIGLTNMIGLPEYQTPYGVLMAGTFLSILPVVILFFILQRDFIAGLSSGAVKG
ncbi:MAG TPA: carbohydrate ABC transporter permease [Tepidisphaeraceae bacterium]|jgi:ABC-type glycerol-3-phosphate transport system permease component